MGEITVLSPLGINRQEAQAISPRVAGLKGLRLGMLSNSKPNVDNLFRMLRDTISEKFEVAEVINRSKPRASLPAEGLESFAKEAQAVITAIGD